MSMSDLIWFICLIITCAVAYYMGKADAPEPFQPSDQAWVAVQCHAIDKQLEYWRWLEERKNGNVSETEETASDGD